MMKSRTILLVDDEAPLRRSLRRSLELAGYEILDTGSATEALRLCREHLPDLVVLDVRLPDRNGLEVLEEIRALACDIPVIMITGYGAVDSAVASLQLGAYDYLEKPVKPDRLLNSLRNALEASGLRTEVERHKREQERAFALDRIIGTSQTVCELKHLIRKVAASQAKTILIQGESGTGKELVARALHYEGDRRPEPFTAVNCAALPEQLLESELFGHERGAFTDAKTLKKGLFEMADGGTLFLDEISEIALGLQAKLLRVLEDRSFRRIGGSRELVTDVRVICATNRDLEQLTCENRFRDDLFYRLSIIPIVLPPLRDRREDIEPLTAHFIEEYNSRFNRAIRGVTAAAREALLAYPWPGNVRELRNAVERAAILRETGDIDIEELPLRVAGFSPPAGGGSQALVAEIPDEGIDLSKVEEELIRRALAKARGNQTQASRLLSISRDALRYKMKKYGLGRRAKGVSHPPAG